MMRRTTLLIGVLALAACSSESTGPTETATLFDTDAILAYDAGGMSGPGLALTGLHRLPPELRLTADQEARIRRLLEQFVQSTKADREALAAISHRARQAAQAGKTAEEVRAILAEGNPIRARLETAEQALQTAIEGVLTDAQKAWLAAHQPQQCNRSTVVALTDAQKTEIRGLIAAFEETHQADIQAVRAALEQARTAQKNGATRAEIKAILDAVKPAALRLAAAQIELHRSIDAVLTAEQRASGCFRHLGPRP